MCPPQSHEQRHGEESLVTKRKDAWIGLKEQCSCSWFHGLAKQLFLGFCLDSVMQHQSATGSTGLEVPADLTPSGCKLDTSGPSKRPLTFWKVGLASLLGSLGAVFQESQGRKCKAP